MALDKTRHLSTYEYLQVLEVEYTVADLRRRIYVKRKDRDFYKKVMKGKEKKIREICSRNSLPCFFSDEKTKLDCTKKVYNEFGYPDFHYKNSEQVREHKAKDFYYYYTKDSEFKVLEEEDVKIGTLVSVDEEKGVAYIKLKGKSITKPFVLTGIARIL